MSSPEHLDRRKKTFAFVCIIVVLSAVFAGMYFIATICIQAMCNINYDYTKNDITNKTGKYERPFYDEYFLLMTCKFRDNNNYKTHFSFGYAFAIVIPYVIFHVIIIWILVHGSIISYLMGGFIIIFGTPIIIILLIIWLIIKHIKKIKDDST